MIYKEATYRKSGFIRRRKKKYNTDKEKKPNKDLFHFLCGPINRREISWLT